MGVHIREIYPGKWYLRITYKNIRRTKAAGSKERAIDLKKKLTTALELYGLDAFKVIEEEKGSEAVNLKLKAPTLDKFQQRWLEELDRTDLKKSTRDNYKFLLAKHIIPAFGNAPLDMLDYSMIKRWVIRMSGKYSKDTVRLMIAVLRVMMQEAVNEGLIVANPVAKLGKFYRSARKVKEKINLFTIEEIHAIEFTCSERFPEYYAFILCMARTGMRIGEVTALQ
jgi:integrase